MLYGVLRLPFLRQYVAAAWKNSWFSKTDFIRSTSLHVDWNSIEVKVDWADERVRETHGQGRIQTSESRFSGGDLLKFSIYNCFQFLNLRLLFQPF